MVTQKPKILQINWLDQITNNPKKTADFYSELLGFEQGTYDEGDGYSVYTADDSYSAHFEHSVAITKDGPVILTKE